MPKTKISEYSATANSNTDIGGINVDEGCAPSGINDAIRTMMAQLKNFQTGTGSDSFNGPVGSTTASTGAFTTLTTSSTVTHNGGTANGVPYLNGSKVLTTGSALTFDGTKLTANTLGEFTLAGTVAGGGNQLNNVIIGASTPLAGAFTTLSATTTGKVGTTLGVGNATPSASGSGITFPATQSASSDANTLDDYEEGTWTPSVGGTATYTTQFGSYTKIGRQVTLHINLTINLLLTGSVNTISGAPFVPPLNEGNYYTGTVYWESIATSEIMLGVFIQQSTGSIYFYGKNTSGTSVDNVVSVIGNGTTVRCTITFNV